MILSIIITIIAIIGFPILIYLSKSTDKIDNYIDLADDEY